MAEPVVLVEVERSGFVEGRHRGSLVVLAADGGVDWAVGDVRSPVYPRSCNKPLQAAGMLGCGLDLAPDLLALVCASHSGEPFQLSGIATILAGAGLSEDDLRTPPDYPSDVQARVDHIRAGGRESALAMNCSGKHAGMLATCVVAGWPTDDYRELDHPLQRVIADTFADATGEQVTSVGVDGCGAPLLSTSLTGLARAFRSLVLAPAGSPGDRVRRAIVAYPEHTSGSRRDEARLLRAVPGAVGKAGAEGCYAVALPDGRALALKLEDGAERGRAPVIAAALDRLGVGQAPGVDVAAVAATGDVPVLGGGRRVGSVRSVL